MSISINEIKEYLLKNNVKPSFPRLKIFKYLVSNQTHPTADDIYKELVEEIPTLSKTTIYNTLDLFIEAKITRPVTIDGNELRYDVDITNHGHFKCDLCGTIYEFDLDMSALAAASLDGFDIREKNVFYKGMCPKCSSDNEAASS